jgi:beta-galactosidase
MRKPFWLIERYKKPTYKLTGKENDFKGPIVYIGEFKVGENHSTFLKMDKFTKGTAIVGTNNVFTNLGRYWPQKGPQVTLYTPGSFLAPYSVNQIILIEFEGSSCGSIEDCYVEFIDYPIIDSLPPK